MHVPPPVLLCLLSLTARAANIVSTNDDGWAEINIRTFYSALTDAGHSVVLSAPAENESGTGSREGTPSNVTQGCEFNSCPADSPATGSNSSDTRLNYVNSYPVTSMKYGVQRLAPNFFNGSSPDLVVAGPNVGANLGSTVQISGTAGAASAASNQLGIPGIAFSGTTGSRTAWNDTTPDYSKLYADLSVNLTNALLASGRPYLPNGTWLNVNFPSAGSGTRCTNVGDFKFVLSRIRSSSGSIVSACNNDTLPTETSVVGTDGCYVSVSVGNASTKNDATTDEQSIVERKLGSALSCLSQNNPTNNNTHSSGSSASRGVNRGLLDEMLYVLIGYCTYSLALML
ncbi:5'/3'-nucleotidase SurE family protein [Paecilomyces variotii No. 5]|uniref:5'/3'-nucleotidase SurE family protein n=1 Tax=Byssochlamys spectabilis (strain No. 5 / NBRC 109023) TaxID=1356009 RepID=V5G4X4_BYSSN|nr:5'/3'-nucleotidase SurE family protein [Paecilomyces variotii No. 5]